MSFDTKTMVIAIILVAVLFVLFLGYAFNNIQKVELDIKVQENKEIDASIKKIANDIIDRYNVDFVDNIALKDIDMDILLINHQMKSACIIRNEKSYAVNYDKLDKSIIYCNSFVVLADDRKALIINCDEILGNAAARAIANAYHYKYTSTSNLSPEAVESFQTVSQDESISFYRYAMIESAKKALFDDEILDNFYYFYDQWTYEEGMNQYQEVINYDYYDGFKEYVYVKALEDMDDGFKYRKYIDSYKNEYGIYTKDDENKVMGMLWCLLMDKQGKNIIRNEDNTTDMYKKLLESIPLGQVDDESMQDDYHMNFAQYIDNIDSIIKEHENDVNTIEPIYPVITAEAYSGTIKVKDNYYIYIDYIARISDNSLQQQDTVFVEMSPYRMKYFFE